MSDYTIFFSWQSDSSADLNKKFILKAIEDAAGDMKIKEAQRVGAEEGMQDVPGSPEVASMMFEKIEQSYIFVGDVSLVGQITKGGHLLKEGYQVKGDDIVKRVPNPNVSIEMGFAAGVLGWPRIICVLNEAFGKREDQPFDMRNRRFPINYRLTADTTPEKKAKVLADLTAEIKGALEVIKDYELERAKKAKEQLDIRTAEMVVHYQGQKEFLQLKAPEGEGSPLFLRDVEVFHRGTVRLLELGLIRTNFGVNDNKLQYSYHWNPLGKKVFEMIPKPKAEAAV